MLASQDTDNGMGTDGGTGLSLDALGLDAPYSLLLDMSGRVVGVNAAWWEATTDMPLGVHCSLGADYLTLCDNAMDEAGDDLREVAREVRAVLAGRRDAVTVPCRRYGEAMNVYWSVKIQRIETVGRTWAMLCWIDTTGLHEASLSQRQMQMRLQNSEALEALRIATSGVAHDLNNLIAAVIGNADLALRRMAHNDNARAHVQELRTSATHAADLVGRLLRRARARRPSRQLVYLPTVARDALEIVRGQIPAHIDVHIDAEDRSEPIEADVTQLRQVAVNLITNALEAIGDSNGVVRISAGHAATGYVHLTVEDSGCGMDENTRGDVFEPFFTTKPSGHGLGLAVVADIVRQSGGTVHVESTPGAGTTFRVLLPVVRV